MPTPEYVLVVAVYADSAEAVADLREITDPDALGAAVGGAGILHRDWRDSALQQAGGGTFAYGVGTGAAAGIVVGVPLGMPIITAAAGAVVGGVIGRRAGRREINGLLDQLDDTVPVGGTALLAVVLADSLVEVHSALTRALRTSGRVLDEGPLTRHARTFLRGNPEVMAALEAQSGPDPDG